MLTLWPSSVDFLQLSFLQIRIGYIPKEQVNHFKAEVARLNNENLCRSGVVGKVSELTRNHGATEDESASQTSLVHNSNGRVGDTPAELLVGHRDDQFLSLLPGLEQELKRAMIRKGMTWFK